MPTLRRFKIATFKLTELTLQEHRTLGFTPTLQGMTSAMRNQEKNALQLGAGDFFATKTQDGPLSFVRAGQPMQGMHESE